MRVIKQLLAGVTTRVFAALLVLLAGQLGAVWYIVGSFQTSVQTLSEQIGDRVGDNSAQLLNQTNVVRELVERSVRIEEQLATLRDRGGEDTNDILNRIELAKDSIIGSLPQHSITLSLLENQELATSSTNLRSGQKIVVSLNVEGRSATWGAIRLAPLLSDIIPGSVDLRSLETSDGILSAFVFSLDSGQDAYRVLRIQRGDTQASNTLEPGSHVLEFEAHQDGFYFIYVIAVP